MTRPNHPARLDRLHRTIALIEGERAAGTGDAAIVEALIDGGARLTRSWRQIRICTAGVAAASATASSTDLLDHWLDAARESLFQGASQ